MGIFGGFIFAWLLLAVFIFALPQMEGMRGKKGAIPSLEGVRAILAIVTVPSPKLLTELEAAHQKGARVQLVTADSVQAPYKVYTVPKERILHDGILLDGVGWYPLP